MLVLRISRRSLRSLLEMRIFGKIHLKNPPYLPWEFARSGDARDAALGEHEALPRRRGRPGARRRAGLHGPEPGALGHRPP